MGTELCTVRTGMRAHMYKMTDGKEDKERQTDKQNGVHLNGLGCHKHLG